jgi:hypothetical protein
VSVDRFVYFFHFLQEEENALSNPSTPHLASPKPSEDNAEAITRRIQQVASNSVSANEIDLRYDHITKLSWITALDTAAFAGKGSHIVKIREAGGRANTTFNTDANHLGTRT